MTASSPSTPEVDITEREDPLSSDPGRGFTITRRLAAPRDAVFRAWTDPDQLRWFGGTPSTAEHPTTVDLRVGGVWRVWLVEDGGRAYMSGGIYREISPPEKLVFSWGTTDGWPRIDPSRLDDNPTVTIVLRDLGDDGTEMVCTVDFADEVSQERIREWLGLGIEPGWHAALDRLPGGLVTDPARDR